MLKDMTLGQYYPVDSFIHGLDPAHEAGGTMLYHIAVCRPIRSGATWLTLFLACIRALEGAAIFMPRA